MSNLVTGWTNDTAGEPFETFVTNGADILEAKDTVGEGYAYSNSFNLTVGLAYRLTAVLVKNNASSYNRVAIMSCNSFNGAIGSVFQELQDGINVINIPSAKANDNCFTIWAYQPDYVHYDTDFSCTFYLKELPPSTLPNLLVSGNLVTNREISSSITIPSLGVDVVLSQKDRQMSANMSLPMMSISGALNASDTYIRGYGLLPAVGLIARTGSRTQLSLPVVALYASGTTNIIGSFYGKLGAIKLTAHGIQNILGSLNAKIPAILLSASGRTGILGELHASIPAIKLSASGIIGIVGSLTKSIGAISLTALAHWTGTNGGTLVLPAIRLTASTLSTEWYAYALNVKNFGLTEYTNFDYNSLCVFNGKMLGAGTDGIHLLEGDTDNGTDIPWRIRTGKLRLGFDKLRYSRLFGEISGDVMLIIETAEGETYEYTFEPVTDGTSEARAKIGKGIRTKYFEAELYNQGRETIKLDMLQLTGKKRR
jgi:hypothetical protein